MLQNNAFVQCLTPLKAEADSYDVCAGEMNTAGCTAELIAGSADSGNLSLATNPGWIAHDYATHNLDYRFSSTTALCAVTQGGLSFAFSDTDRAFYERTAPWSIGAFEYDGPCQ